MREAETKGLIRWILSRMTFLGIFLDILDAGTTDQNRKKRCISQINSLTVSIVSRNSSSVSRKSNDEIRSDVEQGF